MRQRGMTLIELMVALALFAVVGTLCWRATVQMVDTRAAIGAELERWRAISRAVARIESELLVIAPGGGDAFDDSGDGGDRVVSFVTAGDATGAARSGLRFAARRLDWLYWPDGDAARAPETITLLDGVERFDWRYLADGGWTPGWSSGDASVSGLPYAVAIELELADVGIVSRVFALR